jgi:hypothetical protein
MLISYYDITADENAQMILKSKIKNQLSKTQSKNEEQNSNVTQLKHMPSLRTS